MEKQFKINVEWSKNQLRVIESQPNTIIKGPAGSGKTLLALYKAIELISNKKSIALIVFTKSLRTFISDFFHKNGIQEVNVFYEREWSLKSLSMYDVIIIDEYQDFSINDIEQILSRAKEGVYIFGDDEQKLYEQNLKQEKTTTVKQLSDRTRFPIINLFENFRVPKQIVGLINNVYRNEVEICPLRGTLLSKLVSQSYDIKSLRSYKTSTKNAELIQFVDHIDQLEWLCTYLLKNEYKNIGILFKHNDSKFNGYFFNRKLKEEKIPGILETYEYLKSKNIDVGYKYNNQDFLNFTKEININLLTIHSAKGLEFDCVILPFYSWTNRNHNFNIPYVAFSRCSNRLIVLYSGIVSEELHIIQKSVVEGIVRIPSRNDKIDFRYQSDPKRYKREIDDLESKIDKMDEFYGEF